MAITRRVPSVCLLLVGLVGIAKADDYDRGLKAFNEKEYKLAREHFDRAIAKEPKHGLAWHMLAQISWLEGDREKALEECDKAIKIGEGQLASDAFSKWHAQFKIAHARLVQKWGTASPTSGPGRKTSPTSPARRPP